jgi:uncharacterized Rossmann fold enzyme
VKFLDWIEWQPIYLNIVNRLNLNPNEDSRATMILESLLRNTQPEPFLKKLEKMMGNQIIVVCGAGPSLDRHLQEINSSDLRDNAIFVAADGAVSALKEGGYACDIIVTDLDGDMTDILELTKQGSLAIVHGHGDNIEKIEEFVPQFEHIIGSTQVKPTKHVFLWGGFTDGDRACYVASNFNPARIILIGMDFGNIVGRWSKPAFSENRPATEKKITKLKIAEELISLLMMKSNIVFEMMD